MLTQTLAIAHGLFNAAVFLLFLYQAWLGLRVRRARRAKAQPPLAAVRRHRQTGPVLALLGLLGFVVGLALVQIDAGRILLFPAHFSVGSSIVLLILASFLVSRRIKGPDSPLRTPHAVLGALILLLYVVQIALGLRLLL